MKKRTLGTAAALMALCLALSACGAAAESSAAAAPAASTAGSRPEKAASAPAEQEKDDNKPDATATVYADFTNGSQTPAGDAIQEYQIDYYGGLAPSILAQGLSVVTGLNFTVAFKEVPDGLRVDWNSTSALLDPENGRQQDCLAFGSVDEMRWFMMDSLWRTLVKEMKVENVYYTMEGGKKLSLEGLNPVDSFLPDEPYRGSTYYFAQAASGGQGASAGEAAAMDLVHQTMKNRGEDAKVIVSTGEETIEGQHAYTFACGDNSADGEKFTAMYHYAVTDNGTVYYMDVAQGPDWLPVE